MFDTILNFLYPNVCGFCNEICKEGLCKKCELELKKYEIDNINLSDFISIFKYEGIIRKKIIEYKFGDKAYLYKTFAKTILNNKKIHEILKEHNIIIPVPLHKKKKKVRGYNQTELVAKEITKSNPNLKLESNILVKTRNTEVQSLLTKNQRRENIKNAFEVKNNDKIKDKRIILFDDIYTTGATTDECKRILKKAGAKEILVLTIAKD